MSILRTICRPNTVLSSIICCCRDRARSRSVIRVSFQNPNSKPRPSPTSVFSPWFESLDYRKVEPWARLSQRRTMVRASIWTDEKSPYETLELERGAGEEKIKLAYRRLAKFYHPDGGR